MKTLLALVILLLTSSLVVAGERSAGLYISVSLTRGERGRDSNSRQTTITVEGSKVVYEVRYGGYRANKREPIHREYQATGEEINGLQRIIKERNLLVSDSLEYPAEQGPHSYFEITLSLRSGKRESRIEISGPTRAVKIKDEKLYQSSNALIKELFRIINARDKDVIYEDDVL